MKSTREKRDLQLVSAQDPESDTGTAKSRRRSLTKKRGSRNRSTDKKNRATPTELQSKQVSSSTAFAKDTSVSEPSHVSGLEELKPEGATDQQPLIGEMAVQEASRENVPSEIVTLSTLIEAENSVESSANKEAHDAAMNASAAENKVLHVDEKADAQPVAEFRPLLLSRPVDSWAKSLALFCTKLWTWSQRHIKVRRTRKRLRVCESVSLGEKRFIAVIQVDGEEFLVGGAPNSVSTLARLERPQEFSDLLNQQWTRDPVKA